MTTAERLWHDHSRDLRAFLQPRALTARTPMTCCRRSFPGPLGRPLPPRVRPDDLDDEPTSCLASSTDP
jgi:hypothetical protein